MTRRESLGLVLVAAAMAALAGVSPVAAQAQGELVYAMHVTITPGWFDPAENFERYRGAVRRRPPQGQLRR